MIDEKIGLLEKTYSLCQSKTKFLLENLMDFKFRFPEFEDNWENSILNDNIKTISPKNFQIKKTDIFNHGKIPVIDQGKNKIAGYSNEYDKIFKEVPIICFGDHTTNLKFIDYPFIIGGDGLKLIKSTNSNLDSLFLFYAMKKNNISPEGYKRHFSLLKNIIIPIPSFEEQKKISNFIMKLYNQLELINKKTIEFKKFKKNLLNKLFI